MIKLCDMDPSAEEKLKPEANDRSGVGLQYVDAVIKPLKKLELDDGRTFKLKRRGLKLTVQCGEESGEGLLRRLEHGPDPRVLLEKALKEAGQGLSGELVIRDGAIILQ